MDCATACHTDDMAHPIPYEYDHPPAYAEDGKEEGYEEEDEFRDEKEIEMDSEYEDEQDGDVGREVGGAVSTFLFRRNIQDTRQNMI